MIEYNHIAEQEILNLCRIENATNKHVQKGAFIYFIYDGNIPVGCYFPKGRKGFWCMGFIFIAEEYRRKGYALATALKFQRENPGMIWYSGRFNIPSQKIAKKLNLHFIGCEKDDKGNVFDVYQDGYKGG